jgi:hypothetical protein
MYVVMMTIDGEMSPSSAVKIGSRSECEACAFRLNRQTDKHRSVKWVVLESKP